MLSMQPSARTTTVIGLDVGGTSIKGVLTEVGGAVLDENRTAIGSLDPLVALRQTLEALTSRPSNEVLVGIGVAVPGTLSPDRRSVDLSINLGWHDLPLAAFVEDLTGVPTVLEHDARAAALGEWAARPEALGPSESMIFVPIGTGISCSIVVGGVAAIGASHRAGEFGHTTIWPDGELCACGNHGCLELYASGRGLTRQYFARTGAMLTPEDLLDRITADEDAAAVWSTGMAALGIGLVSLSAVIDPSLIVLGGGVAQAGSALLAPVRDQMLRRLRWRPVPELHTSVLGEAAGRIGAARCATAAGTHPTASVR